MNASETDNASIRSRSSRISFECHGSHILDELSAMVDEELEEEEEEGMEPACDEEEKSSKNVVLINTEISTTGSRCEKLHESFGRRGSLLTRVPSDLSLDSILEDEEAPIVHRMERIILDREVRAGSRLVRTRSDAFVNASGRLNRTKSQAAAFRSASLNKFGSGVSIHQATAGCHHNSASQPLRNETFQHSNNGPVRRSSAASAASAGRALLGPSPQRRTSSSSRSSMGSRRSSLTRPEKSR